MTHMGSESKEAFGGPVTNTTLPKPAYGPLFFVRTGMLIFAWACTSVVIALQFWATDRAIKNRNTLFNAFQPPAVVWVSVHDIYTASMITALAFCILWLVFTVGIIVSMSHARKPYENFGGIPHIIIALSFWILISGAAETWFFARTGLRLFVSIDNVQMPQSEVDAVLVAAGVAVWYKNSTMWRVAVSFVWITWLVAITTAAVLFVADHESTRFVRPTNFSTMADNELNIVRLVNVYDKDAKRLSLDSPPPLSSLSRLIGGDIIINVSKESEIQEMRIENAEKQDLERN